MAERNAPQISSKVASDSVHTTLDIFRPIHKPWILSRERKPHDDSCLCSHRFAKPWKTTMFVICSNRSEDDALQNITKRQGAFDHWLRIGRVLEDAAESPVSERKFNPWHDPDDGRFTFSEQGQYYSGGASHHPPRRRPAQSSARPTAPKSTPSPLPMSRTTEAPLGFLAESQEAPAPNSRHGQMHSSDSRRRPRNSTPDGALWEVKRLMLSVMLSARSFCERTISLS